MRGWIEFFVRNHLFGNLLTVFVIGVGIAAAFQIKREAFPNIKFDILSVVSIFPGATPEDVEKLVTNPIEQDLKEVDGIKKVQSVSVENQSTIIITLDPDQTTEAKGKSDVEDVIDSLEDYPKDAEKPKVITVESKREPIIEISLAGPVADDRLLTIGESIEKEIESLKGVAKVVIRGKRDREFHVEADPIKLARERVTLDEVILSLKRQNLNVPGGSIEARDGDLKTREKFVRTVGELRNIKDIENTVVRANDLGQPITVKAVAKVTEGLERARILTRTDGKSSLNLTVLKKENADAIDMVDLVRDRMEQLKPQLAREQIEIAYIDDFSMYIRRRLGILTSNLAIGLLLVLGCLPLLIPFRFSLLIALGEPFAFLGTILLMHYFGYSINLISMIGLIIVSGILVDDSIVVTENAVRLVEKGWTPIKAAVEGTMQIIGPLTASVLTTSMAFLPMAFMSGIFGKFIVFIPIAVLLALMVSLFETFFILPSHVAHWIKSKEVTQAQAAAKRPNIMERFLGTTRSFWDARIVPLYLKFLAVSIRRRYLVMSSVLGFVGFSIFFAASSMRVVLFPPDGIEVFFIRTEAPPGTSLHNHALALEAIEKKVAALDKTEMMNFTTTVGLVQQDVNDPNTRRGPEFGQIVVYLTPEMERKRKAEEIIADLRAKVGKPPEFDKLLFARINPGPPTGKPISLGVRGKTYEEILPAVTELEKILAQMDGVMDVSNSYLLGKDELRLIVDDRQARSAGLNVDVIGNSVRAAFEGIEATKVRSLDEERAIRVSFPRDYRESAEAIKAIAVPNPQGALIPLSQITRVERQRAPLLFQHEDNQREVRVTGDVDVKKTSALEANGKIRELIPEFKKKFPAVTVAFGGEDEDTIESFQSLGRAFMLALLGIFLILVLTMKSLMQPFLVLLTIPLGLTSVIWVFFVHQLPISFMGMLGVIALAGIIVNNAIVFIDFINQRRAEGMDQMQSVLEGAKDRVRPIFLTSITTVVGILPTAYGWGGLDMFVVPIAMALGWGIFAGSILTAFVFPASVVILDDVQGLFKK